MMKRLIDKFVGRFVYPPMCAVCSHAMSCHRCIYVRGVPDLCAVPFCPCRRATEMTNLEQVEFVSKHQSKILRTAKNILDGLAFGTKRLWRKCVVSWEEVIGSVLIMALVAGVVHLGVSFYSYVKKENARVEKSIFTCYHNNGSILYQGPADDVKLGNKAGVTLHVEESRYYCATWKSEVKNAD